MPVLIMSDPVLDFPSDGPLGTSLVWFSFVVILPCQVTVPECPPSLRQALLLAVPAPASCGPPPPSPYCSLPHDAHVRLVSLGLATVSRWEQELHRGPDHSQEVLVE